MKRILLALALLALPTASHAQTGIVSRVTSAWSTNAFGDQLIVSTVTVNVRGRAVDVAVEGGTVDGTTMEVADAKVPAVGRIVRLEGAERGAPRIKSDGDDFVVSAYTWPGTEAQWFLNPQNLDMTEALAEREAAKGAHAWQLQTGAPFLFRYAGRTASTTIAVDAVNTVIFRNARKPENPNAIATTYTWIRNGVRFDGDIVVWDAWARMFATEQSCWSGSDGVQVGVYLLDVLTHEFGHAVGMGHSSVAGATMYPTYRACGTTLRSLAADDINGYLALYGE